MKKLLSALPLLVFAGSIAGCDLYFGDHHDDNDSWTYCGSDGYYQCQGNDCELTATTCPPDSSGSGGNGSGYECGSNADCAAGCYCSDNTCTEGGFCTTDADCGQGYTCDTSRSSCEPTPTPSCGSDADCTGTGQYCDTASGTCDQGSCAGTITCNIAAPTCASGSTPIIANGCYTGGCEAIATCDAPPVCASVNDETDCLARTADCQAVYAGQDCTTTDGTACVSGDAGCTCATFSFDHCTDKTPPQ